MSFDMFGLCSEDRRTDVVNDYNNFEKIFTSSTDVYKLIASLAVLVHLKVCRKDLEIPTYVNLMVGLIIVTYVLANLWRALQIFMLKMDLTEDKICLTIQFFISIVTNFIYCTYSWFYVKHIFTAALRFRMIVLSRSKADADTYIHESSSTFRRILITIDVVFYVA